MLNRCHGWLHLIHNQKQNTDSDNHKKKKKKKKTEKEETLQDEGAAEEKGQLLFLSYGNGNEVGHGAQDNRGPQAG